MGFFGKLFGRSAVSEREIEDTLNSFYTLDESEELSAFISKYKKNVLLQMIKAIDIKNMPVKTDSPGMRGMQCMIWSSKKRHPVKRLLPK